MNNSVLDNDHVILNPSLSKDVLINKTYQEIVNKFQIILFALLKSKVLWLVSLTTIIELVWFASQHIGFTSDSTTYWLLSKYLITNIESGSYLYFRTPGYPLLMLLGGVPFFESFRGLLFLQALMAILIPVLIYKTLFFITPRAAFLGALVSIVSLLPVVYSKAVMTEQAFIFTITLLMYLLVLYKNTKKTRHFYILTTCLIFLTFLRPSANMIFLIIFPFCLFVSIKNYKHILMGIAFYLIINAAWSSWVRLNISPNVIGQASINNKIKQNMFYFIYARNTGEKNYLNPQNGPASNQLHSYLVKYVTQAPGSWESSVPNTLFSKYKGFPQEFIKEIYHHPNPHYFQYLANAITSGMQSDPNNKQSLIDVLTQAAWESIANKPSLLFSFIWKNSFGSSMSFAAQMLFYQVYVAANASIRQGTFFKPENGPASKRLMDDIRQFVYEHPESYESIPFYAQYKGEPEKLIQEKLMKNPNKETHWFMWSMMDTIYTPLEAPQYFLAAALEGIRKHPTIFIVLVENLNAFFFGPSTTFCRGTRKIAMTHAGVPHWWEDSALPEIYKGDIKSGFRYYDTSSWMVSKGWPYWGYVWLFIKPILFLVILMTFLFGIGTRYFGLMLTLITLLVYQGFVASVFAEPSCRYVDHVVLVALVLAVISVSFAFSHFRLKNGTSKRLSRFVKKRE